MPPNITVAAITLKASCDALLCNDTATPSHYDRHTPTERTSSEFDCIEALEHQKCSKVG